MNMPVEPQVSYSVKEILDRIEGKVDTLVAGLASKADVSALIALGQQVDQHSRLLDQLSQRLKDTDETAAAKQDWRRWIIPTILSLVATAAMIIPLIPW